MFRHTPTENAQINLKRRHVDAIEKLRRAEREVTRLRWENRTLRNLVEKKNTWAWLIGELIDENVAEFSFHHGNPLCGTAYYCTRLRAVLAGNKFTMMWRWTVRTEAERVVIKRGARWHKLLPD